MNGDAAQHVHSAIADGANASAVAPRFNEGAQGEPLMMMLLLLLLL